MADIVKDSGAVTMFPPLAEEWLRQVRAEEGWAQFGLQDFTRLRQKFGVTWLVLAQPGIAGLHCPYQNVAVMVCTLQP